MKVLVIGDEHTYGYGLPGKNLSYIGHFIRQISRSGRAVSVEAYAHLSLSQMVAMLAKLPLSRYDLILLQLDPTLMQTASLPVGQSAGIAIPLFPGSAGLSKPIRLNEFGRHIDTIGAALRSLVRSPGRLTGVLVLLDQLRPYRHNVLLLTPFPHQKPVSRWVRRRSRMVLLREAQKRLVSVFDTDSIIRPREEYFLANDAEHLNAVSHELLGRALFDFYQSAPTIVTIQANRRD